VNDLNSVGTGGTVEAHFATVGDDVDFGAVGRVELDRAGDADATGDREADADPKGEEDERGSDDARGVGGHYGSVCWFGFMIYLDTV